MNYRQKTEPYDSNNYQNRKVSSCEIGYIGNSIIGDTAESKDVYENNKELCD